MDSKIIAITGTPGAGKTTVLENALDKLGEDVKIINYADMMLEAGKDMGVGSDHDAIRKLPLGKQRELQERAAKNIADCAEGVVIVDTHSTVRTPSGYLPGLPEWVVRALKPQVILLVEANPEEIVGRRTNDPTRKRDAEAIEGIELHQQINRASALAAAELCGAAVKVIKNHDNGLDEASAELVELVGGL